VWSAAGEGVVAELVEDVAGLPDDLAGLGQRGPLTVDPVFGSGVVVVVGGGAVRVSLAGLVQHQRSTAGPCLDGCPGERFPSEE
jgi:hypothetical protein